MAKQELVNAPKRNIINSKDWKEQEWLTYFQERFSDMRAKKEPFNALFTEYELQETAISYYDNQWSLQVQVPLEQNLTEIYMWRTNWKLVYDIIPDWQADIEELQPAKYTLAFYLDWNQKNNFWKENKDFRQNKATYGTWIWYTWIRSYKDYRYEIREEADIQSWTDLLNPKNFDKLTNETWFFFPKSIHPKDFYPDDACYGQTDIQNARDCVFKEKLSYMEFQMRYWENKAFINIDKVISWTDENPKNLNDTSVSQDEIIVYHFFDRITKKYLIVVNESILVYNWLYLYNDWKLPFVSVQHYTNNNCIWGRWIPHRIGYLKAYKSEILQDILVWAEMWSGVNLITWNDDEIGQDWQVWGRWVNIWRTTWWADRVQQINTQPNLPYFTNVLAILDDLIVQDTGDNPRAPIETGEKTLGQTEIREANKAVRQSSVDENYNIGLDEALTMTLDRIKQFAPSLLSEKIKDSEWKVIKTIFPQIRIDWYEVKKEEWKQVIVENLGKYGYFELKPGVVQWVWVKVVTSSSNSMLPILERQRVTEYVNNLLTIWQLAQFDPTIAQKLQESINFDELMSWMWDAYGYDTKLKANTEKDKIAEKNKKKILELKEKLTLTNNPIPNEDIWQNNPQVTASQEVQTAIAWQGQPNQMIQGQWI